MKKAILLLGSNLGNKIYYLTKALKYIEKKQVIKINEISSTFESEAVGYESANRYYNIAVEIESELSPQSLLKLCLAIETELSRTRSLSQRYIDRIIDIDIILIDETIIKEPNLIVPHPRMHERLFCLMPLNEIAPNWMVPTLNKTVKELFASIENSSKVIKVDVKI